MLEETEFIISLLMVLFGFSFWHLQKIYIDLGDHHKPKPSLTGSPETCLKDYLEQELCFLRDILAA